MPSFLDTLDQINQGLQGWSNTPQGMSQILSMRGIDTASQADILGQQQAIQEAQYRQEENAYQRQQREIEAQRIARARELLATMEPGDAAKLRELMAIDPAAAKQFMDMYARPAASSTIGKIQADIDAGLIDPATGAAALKKATTIPPVYDPATGYWMYPSGTGGGGSAPMGGGAAAGGMPTGGESMEDIPIGMNPLEAKAFREQRAAIKGKTLAEDEKLFDAVSTRLPSLLEKVSKASDLADKATYTLTGEVGDFVANRIFGVETEGGTAKSEYEGIVLNEVLPTLSEVFPGSVTEGERESLKDMMGSLSLTPDQKRARIKQYVLEKLNKVREIGARLGKDTSFLDTYQQQLEMIGAPKDDLQNLTPDEVEYLKSKGLL